MFDTETLGRFTGGQLLELAASNHQTVMEAENQALLIAAAWADDQDRDLADDYAPLIHRSTVLGGEGCPQVSEFAATELGAVLGVGVCSGRAVIADALDLRHRLPSLWRRVCAGHVRAWQARRIAKETRPLTWEQAGEVDAAVSGFVGAMPWPRFERILFASILQADPERLAERAERARTERMVRAFRSEDGLRTVVARATSGDVAWFMATVNRIADILGVDGDTDLIEVRRSKAIGILANPAQALQLLIRHRGDKPSDEPLNPALAGERDHSSLLPDAPHPHIPHSHAPVADPALTPSAVVEAVAKLDSTALRPRVVLYFHLAEAALSEVGGLVRPEHGEPLSLDQLHEFLADTGCKITVRPVITPADTAPVDGYEIPARIREAVRLRTLVDVFPYGSCASAGMDLDHTIAYRTPPLRQDRPHPEEDQSRPPAQTGLHNLGPLSRSSHRAATPGRHAGGRWLKRQPDPGTYLWRSPHGWIYLVTADGTLRLGTGSFALSVWRAAVLAEPPALAA